MKQGKEKKLPELKEFLGRSYILVHSEDYNKFLQELRVKKNTRLQAINSKPIVTLFKEKEEYVLSTSYPEGRHIKVKFKPDEEVLKRRGCTSTARSVFHVLHNLLIEELYFDEYKVLIIREFKHGDLTVTMEVNEVKCCRLYSLLRGSNQSIKTETSRRSFFSSSSGTPVMDEESLPSGEEFQVEQEEEEEEEDLCF